ncbi:glycosyltransferase family 4 protein [Microbacterium sp. PRC9]|uniref:glycosyltransferase family 4 protein n=1 Tax=Microbacterium sp. PRC9 TaxID=2962591 RepID=UPI002881F658|nr:glycosyltransferase family 4 protein [Microbacterium sp. PRC9]MDT0141473.1 glycosyltransferase family 4 protein [Microbacterium sp. PRC9]
MSARARRLYHATESRFHRDSTGSIRSPHPVDAYTNQRALLELFDEIVVLARVDEEKVSDNGEPVTGPGVSVVALPSYRGAVQAVRALPQLNQAVRSLEVDESVASGRLPGVVATVLQRHARREHMPFLGHVVGDPFDVMNSGVSGRLGALAAPILRAMMRRQVRNCQAVTYVSTAFLQRRYPARRDADVLVRPGARIGDGDLKQRNDFTVRETPVLLAVGSQEQLYKGHDQIIRVAGRLARAGVLVHVVLIGEGRYQSTLRALAAEHGVAEQIEFVGGVNHTEINGYLDRADVFLMPSMTEGLPRALVEAMARSLPAIGSDAGGIPELLEPDAVVARGDEAELESAIRRALESEQWRASQGRRNYEKAIELSALTDDARWLDFLRNFRDRGSNGQAR